MILNETDYKTAIDKISFLLDSKRVHGQLAKQLILDRAGLKAEKQMAYSLKSYFADSNNIHVINNFKFTHNGQNTQIDHLVFSQRAVYFIESKSISDTIMVNEHGEFFRKYGKKETPINSPIEQVKSQRTAFLNFLETYIESILGKYFGIQKHLGSYTYKEYVAISEKGRISGSGRNLFPTLCKYDQISSKINDHHKGINKNAIKTFISDNNEEFLVFIKSDFEKLKHFLVENNIAPAPIDSINTLFNKQQVDNNKLKQPDSIPKSNIPGYTCKHCNSKSIQVTYGKYGYYFKCKECSKNTPINLTCSTCNGKMRIRKSKEKFYQNCSQCQIESYFYTNLVE